MSLQYGKRSRFDETRRARWSRVIFQQRHKVVWYMQWQNASGDGNFIDRQGRRLKWQPYSFFFFLFEPTYSRRVKQSLGYERGCNRKLIIDAGCRLSVHCMSDLGLLRSPFTIDLYCLLGKPSQLLKFVSSLVKVYHD